MFTPEQKEKISAAFAAKDLKPCPMCGMLKTWTVGDGLAMVPIHVKAGQRFMPTRQMYPCIPLICLNCGNTAFHNAYYLGLEEVLGLVPADPPLPPPTMPPIPGEPK